MRLIQRKGKGVYELTMNLEKELIPEYAILSHTWLPNGRDEVSLQDLKTGNGEKKASYEKIRFCGEQAAKDGLEYFWLDTCCIKQDSSAELQMSIASMFKWYKNAKRCYAYLRDVFFYEAPDPNAVGVNPARVPSMSWEQAFRKSRWFTRGWTLQELLAPPIVEFFSADQVLLGDRETLKEWIHETTNIPKKALEGDISSFTVTERMSWAEKRTTLREEDRAYCLLGILGVFIHPIYGEGNNAFSRLWDETSRRQDNNHQRVTDILSKLPIASEAAFNSFNNQHEPTCLPTTRRELLQEITEWADSLDERHIFWLNGLAGTGKSTIARTIARTYHERGQLGGSFFFSRGDVDLGTIAKFIPTLASQIATGVPIAGRFICEAVVKQRGVLHQSLQDQFEQLILAPLAKSNINYPPFTVLIVVDSLDEIVDAQDIRLVIRTLASVRLLTNVRLRILLTSRPETPIRYMVGQLPEAEREIVFLHNISPSLVDRDLTLFFESNFSSMREECGDGGDDDWPGIEIIKRLVEMSCGLFIWAAAACRFIRQGQGKRFAGKRITALINGSDSGDSCPQTEFDQIYTVVVQASVLPGYSRWERALLRDMQRDLFGNIILLFLPLCLKSLSNLIGKSVHDIKDLLIDLPAIFQMPSQSSSRLPIRLHHPIFRNFILNKDRCRDMDVSVDGKVAHSELAEKCVSLMMKMLKKNICDLSSSGTLVEDIDPRRIEECIPDELQYACLYWVQHLRLGDKSPREGDIYHTFIQQYFLYWVEAIALMGKTTEMGAIMRMYHSLLPHDENVNQIPFCKDARKYIFEFLSIIKQAPLQTYSAALVFLPPYNSLKNHFRDQMLSWVHSMRIAQPDVDKTSDRFHYKMTWQNELVFTHDNLRIAAGGFYPGVRLWDVATKAVVGTFEASKDKNSCVAISPDGATIASGSDDFTVSVWDVRTRQVRYTLTHHKRWVNSVAFSPNGKRMASGSMDETIAIWDVATGQGLDQFDNQGSCVNSVIFSPDSSLIATGANDQIVRLWKVSRNLVDLQAVLKAHTGPVNSVQFSPDGTRLVSGSDDMTVRIWDPVAGAELQALSGHTKRVMTAIFSLDGRLILTGSEDMTVRIWNASNGAQLRSLDHPTGINSVTFSPNGRLLATLMFNDNVRLWNTTTWESIGELDEFEIGAPTTPTPTTELINTGHPSTITSTVFSPDGNLVASGSQDGTIKLWLRGGEEHCKLEGHSSGSINHLSFSPDAAIVASASADATVKLWNSSTGILLKLLRAHKDSVVLTRFSPDGRKLASCSIDSQTILWDVRTGELLARLQADDRRSTTTITTTTPNPVKDVTFSPNGRFLAACWTDATIVILDLTCRTITRHVDGGHTDVVNSISFSPDDSELLVVSGSDDASIRLLWTKTGESRGSLAKNHHNNLLPVKSVAFSPDGKQLVSSSSTNNNDNDNEKDQTKINNIITTTVRLWDATCLSEMGMLDSRVEVSKLAFSTCGRYVETDRGVLDVRLFSSSSSSSSSSAISLLDRSNALFVTRDWLTRDMENLLWLPDEYHATSVAVHGQAVVLGHSSGSMSFINV